VVPRFHCSSFQTYRPLGWEGSGSAIPAALVASETFARLAQARYPYCFPRLPSGGKNNSQRLRGWLSLRSVWSHTSSLYGPPLVGVTPQSAEVLQSAPTPSVARWSVDYRYVSFWTLTMRLSLTERTVSAQRRRFFQVWLPLGLPRLAAPSSTCCYIHSSLDGWWNTFFRPFPVSWALPQAFVALLMPLRTAQPTGYYGRSVAIGLSSLRRSPGYTSLARVALRSSVRCLPPHWRLPRTDVLRCLGVVDTVCPGWPNITIRARVPLVTAQLEFGQCSSNHMQLDSPGIV
jgi:hypothetical protein